MRPILSISLITAACVGGFALLRSMPVEQCQLLHYGDYLNEQGAIEGCGFEEADFFDLQTLRFPLQATVTPISTLRAGEPAHLRIEVGTLSGKPIGYPELAISHTERLHAMVVDAQAKDYQHVHPTDAGTSGAFNLDFQPRRAGTYHVFLDFVVLETGRRVLLHQQIDVLPGTGTVSEVPADASLAVELIPVEKGPLRANQTHELRLEYAREGAETLHFEKVMDSFAHVVAFDTTMRGFAHLHPLATDLALNTASTTTHPDLRFRFRPDRPGTYTVWAQAKIDGTEVFRPFEIEVVE